MDNAEINIIKKINKLRSSLRKDTSEVRGKDLVFYNNNKGKSSQLLIEKDSTDEHYGRLLFNLIRKYKPKRCLEIGTCLGISASYIKAGQTLNGEGELISLEGINKRAEIAKNNLEDLDFSNFEIIVGQFKDTLLPTLEKYGKFDFVFLDAHHKLKHTLKYLDMIIPHLDKDAIMIIDDLDLSEEMEKAWDIIIKYPKVFSYQRLGKWGMVKFK